MPGLEGQFSPETLEDPRTAGVARVAGIQERSLVDQAREGSTRAFGELVRLHQDAIFGLVIRMVSDRAVAEELTQDTFIKAFRNLGSFRGEAKLSTWLYRIAVNLCHDYHASASARMRRGEQSLDASETRFHQVPARSQSPSDAAVSREMEGAFESCLGALEPRHREAFVLRHQEDLGYDAIAEVLGISRSNAKVRVHRAREAILRHLRKLGHDV